MTNSNWYQITQNLLRSADQQIKLYVADPDLSLADQLHLVCRVGRQLLIMRPVPMEYATGIDLRIGEGNSSGGRQLHINKWGISH